MSTIPFPQRRRELAHRVNGGLEIRLLWSPPDNNTTIEVKQPSSDETLTFPVPRDHALEAFYHPFAHLAAAAAHSWGDAA